MKIFSLSISLLSLVPLACVTIGQRNRRGVYYFDALSVDKPPPVLPAQLEDSVGFLSIFLKKFLASIAALYTLFS